jgi:PPP family 3-phenylpropionic acid transporter
LPIWLADRGLPARQIGVLLAVASLVRLVAVPLWGLAADQVGHRRPMLLLAATGAAAASAGLPAAHGLGPLLMLITAQGLAAAALTPLADTLTLALAQAGRLIYGRTRAWGSVSYMAATAAAGPVLAWAGSGLVPWLVAASYGSAALVAPLLPEAGGSSHRSRRTAGLWRIPALRLVIAASALIQGSHAAYYGFAALHWRAAGIGDTAIGLLIALGIVMEIVLFIWGGAWALRLGPARLTALAALACVIRWTALAFTTAIPVLCAAQVLHAASFAMQHLSSMAVLGRVVPPHRAAGAQTLLAALGFSAPIGLLIWLCGLGYADMGGLIFLPMAALGGGALLLVAPMHRALIMAARPQPV